MAEQGFGQRGAENQRRATGKQDAKMRETRRTGTDQHGKSLRSQERKPSQRRARAATRGTVFNCSELPISDQLQASRPPSSGGHCGRRRRPSQTPFCAPAALAKPRSAPQARLLHLLGLPCGHCHQEERARRAFSGASMRGRPLSLLAGREYALGNRTPSNVPAGLQAPGAAAATWRAAPVGRTPSDQRCQQGGPPSVAASQPRQSRARA